MSKLFLVYLGGRTPKSNIELHDVQFVAGECIEDTFETLRERWFGTKKGLHLDSYAEIRFVDGYKVALSAEPPTSSEKLYFVNLGGYDENCIVELHQFGLFVATSPDEAKKRALGSLLVSSLQQHRDDLFDVDDCFSIDTVGRFHVHLSPSSEVQELKPDWFGYRVIG